MREVASSELRNDIAGLLRRVAGGENVVITVDGQPVARLSQLDQRPRWVTKDHLIRRLSGRQADPGLLAELRVEGSEPDRHGRRG